MSGGVQFEIRGPKRAEWDAVERKGIRAMARALELSLEATREQIEKTAPRGESNKLGKSWKLVRVSDFVYRLESDREYARFVSEGTAPHEIRPRNKKVLRFSVAGNTVYARRVRHPGTRANPYVDTAFDDAERKRDSYITQAMREVFGA